MKITDLSHTWSSDMWPFIGTPSPSMNDLARIPGQRVLMRQITTNMHIGTHIDAPIHFVSGMEDMASIKLEQLCHEGVIVDVSDKIRDWDFLYPEQITDKVDVKEGDILIINYGWHKYFWGCKEQSEEKYFCYHPGPSKELADWMIKKKLRWFGVDTGSADHPMNIPILRRSRPDLVKKFEQKIGKSVTEVFTEDDFQFMHTKLFPHQIIHAENIGGEIDDVLNKRCMIGAFPWKLKGGDGCICRIVAFSEDDH
jgi:arylformamidase